MDFIQNIFNDYIINPINNVLLTLHVTLPSSVILIIGLFIVLKVFNATKSILHLIRTISLVFIVASLINSYTLPVDLKQSASWLMPQVAIPIGLLAILFTYISTMIVSFAKYRVYGLIFSTVLSIFGLGYVSSYLHPTGQLSNIFGNLPGLQESFTKGASSLQNAANGIKGNISNNRDLNQSKDNSSNNTSNITIGNNVDYGKLTDKVATQSLANSVLTDEVAQKLGKIVKYNSEGYFEIDGNKPNITNNHNSAWINVTPKNARQQLGKAEMTADFSTYQPKNRSETSSNGKSNSSKINPPGWNQLKIKGSSSGSWLYQRGHTLGYSIMGGYSGFDASEANVDNISTQTAMANASLNKNGQNYWEGIVRNAIKNHKVVRYEVEPIYQGNNLVPSLNHIEAQSTDGSVSFNVAIPNVQPGVKINYTTGFAQIIGRQ